MAEEEFDNKEEDLLANVLSSGNYEIDQKMGGGIPLNSLALFEQYFRNCRVPNTIPSHATIQPQSPRERPPKPSRIHSHSAKTDHPSAK